MRELKEVERETLGETLERVLENNGSDITIGTLAERVGDKGFGLLLILLSLPSALPIPAPGYSTPFGILMAIVAIQMIVGRHAIWIPDWIAKRAVGAKLQSLMHKAAHSFLAKIERFIRPRHQWIHSRFATLFLASIILCMSALMMLPVPLTNTLPAMVIFLIAVGFAEEDGLLSLLAFAIGIVAVVVYAFVVYLLITKGSSAITELIDRAKDLF